MQIAADGGKLHEDNFHELGEPSSLDESKGFIHSLTFIHSI